MRNVLRMQRVKKRCAFTRSLQVRIILHFHSFRSSVRYLKLNTAHKEAASHRYLVHKPFDFITTDCMPKTRGRRIELIFNLCAYSVCTFIF